MRNCSPGAGRIGNGSKRGSRSKDGSSWPWMACSPMSGMRCSGWCATASRDPILLARPLLSSTQGDLTALRTFVKQGLEPWKVPVTGGISDGQETIGSAVAFVFPEVPHQRCQFHYLKDATKPLYEADRNAKTELKKQLRGVRPTERAEDSHPTPQNDAIRGACLAVRAPLTDHGRSPLDAPRFRLHARLTHISASIGRID